MSDNGTSRAPSPTQKTKVLVSLRTSAAALVWQSVPPSPVGADALGGPPPLFTLRIPLPSVGAIHESPADLLPDPTDGRAMLGPTVVAIRIPRPQKGERIPTPVCAPARNDRASLCALHGVDPRFPQTNFNPCRAAAHRNYSLFIIHFSLLPSPSPAAFPTAKTPRAEARGVFLQYSLFSAYFSSSAVFRRVSSSVGFTAR